MNEHISIVQGYIDHLEYMKKNADEFFDREQADKDIEAFKAAIKALEQEPCEDAISRQAVLDKKELVELEDGQSFYCIDPEQVETLQLVTPQPKIGHWINGDCKGGNCSVCGEYYAFYPESGDFNYCPNCGAKMDEQQESEGIDADSN